MSSEFETMQLGKSIARSRPQRLPLLHPMEVGEVLDETFDLYKRNFRLFFSITILIGAPLSLVRIAVAENRTAALIAVIVTSVIYFLTYTALTLAAFDRLLGRPVTLVATYRASLKPYGRVLLGLLIFSLVSALIMGVCLLPGLLLRSLSEDLSAGIMTLGFFVALLPLSVLMLWSLLLIPVAGLEKQSLGVLGRCRRLIKGNFWRLALLSMGLLALVLIEFLVAGSLAALIFPFTGTKPLLPPQPGDTGALLSHAAYIVVDTLLQSTWMPIYAIVALLAYIDLRIRSEAYDIELLTDAAEAWVNAERGQASAVSLSGGALG